MRRVWLPVILSLMAAGCVDGNSTGGMDIPTISIQPADGSTSDSSLFAEAPHSSFRLHKIVASVKRDQVIVHFPGRHWKKWKNNHLCNIEYGNDATAKWGSTPRPLGDWQTEWGEIFYQTMKEHGANVVGDVTKIFGLRDNVKSAEYLIGARITDIRGNICDQHDYWNGRPLNKSLGEVYLKIEWQVFSALNRRVTHKFTTEGYAQSKKGKRNGFSALFDNAFEAAVDRAAQDKGFRKALARQAYSEPRVAKRLEPLTLKGAAHFRSAIRNHVNKILAAVVTIEFPGGHGSGFLIARDGYVLTNAHVVGKAKKVAIVFTNGVRVGGNVIRLHRARDVALIKLPITVKNVLPIDRNTSLEPSDTVYAVGTPLLRSLEATVTKGIVSAHRQIRGRPVIQADVATTGGSSGGPLLDTSGNVVGISFAGFTKGQNLNLFIPIDDALKILNVTVTAR